MNPQLIQNRQGLVGFGPGDSLETVDIVPTSRNRFGSTGGTVNVPLYSVTDPFELLPVVTTVVATSDKYHLLIGSNTPVASVSAKMGLTLTTGATSTNQAGIAGIANTPTKIPITASGGIFFRTMVRLPSVTATNYYSAGLNQNPTDVNPMATGGEGVAFLADPTNQLTATTGATAAQALNWILCFKVNGAYTYGFTNVPIVAGIDIALKIQLNPDLTATCTINVNGVGTVVGTSPPLATANAVLAALIGCRTLTVATAATIDVRFDEMGASYG
jgi:hypothetical protein